MPTFRNNLAREDIVLGIIVAKGVSKAVCPFSLKPLHDDLQSSVGDFSQQYEERRKAVRDILRNGTFKPSGRSKPASEYLVRTLVDGESLPTINPVVDIFNILSARYQVPISVWDIGKCPTSSFGFSLGGPDDSYVFNNAGHEIKLTDLVAGFALGSQLRDGRSPVVSPVKDAHAVKVTTETDSIAAAIYLPQSVYNSGDGDVAGIFEMAAELLREAANYVQIQSAFLSSGDEVIIDVE